jgi:hypothetical protein
MGNEDKEGKGYFWATSLDLLCAFLALSQQVLAQQEIDSTQICRRCSRVIRVHSVQQTLYTAEHDAVR